ncbi:MAG TPA: hypothetical protein VJT67_02010 [Longimicrobiaceae bacterium]|nr:hypothetical protein [Longimicrobiaceae bacterium]
MLARQLLAADLDASVEGRRVSEECRFRVALGRAYYALFLSIRNAIARQHGIRVGWINHGLLHTYMRHLKAGPEVQALGHELRRLYALRQQADYEMNPTPEWHRKLTDSRYVELMTKQAIAGAATLDQLDFGPVLELMRG